MASPFDQFDFFPADYAAARARFLREAQSAGADVQSHVLPGCRGPAGEELAIDVARVGAADAAAVLLVTSGLHGVEGFFGSAVQSSWLSERASGGAAVPKGIAVAFVHALNPYGFAWGRRWNENGVDLNRNFVDDWSFRTDDPAYAESRAAYERLSAFLNPETPPVPWEPYALKSLAVLLAQGRAVRAALPAGEARPSPLDARRLIALGLGELKKTLPVGQYEWPGRLFYGGAEAELEWTARTVRENVAGWTRGAKRVVLLDLHTGLGQYGACSLLLDEESGSDSHRWMADRFAAFRVEPAASAGDGGAAAYRARGTLLHDCRARLAAAGADCHGAVAEFGTYSAARVLGALRAENRAHRFGRPGDASYRWAKRQVRAAFCPDDVRWRAAVEAGGRDLLAAGLRALSAPGG